LVDNDIVLVGGLVPSLLIDQEGTERHAGTTDLDLGLALAVLHEERYRELAARLRDAGFKPDTNEKGQATRQRWRLGAVTVDFLIPPTAPRQGGRLQDLEADLAAIITPGLALAFRDQERPTLKGTTSKGEKAERSFPVCGPAAFVVLKALAFEGRGENKDAYDLFYVLKHFGNEVDEIADRLVPLLDAPEAARALEILARDFADTAGVGPRRVAEFLAGGPDDAMQADTVGLVREFLAAVETARRR